MEDIQTAEIFQHYNRTVHAIAEHAAAASWSYCSASSSPPVVRVLFIDTKKRLQLAQRVFNLSRLPTKMWKNALSYMVAIAEASSPYLFHVDDDCNISAPAPTTWLSDSIELLDKNAHLNVLSLMACWKKRNWEFRFDPFQPILLRHIDDPCGSHPVPSNCSRLLYEEAYWGFWSTQVFLMHTERFRSLWPFPKALVSFHIESMFSIGSSLATAPGKRFLLSGGAFLDMESWRVCKNGDWSYRWMPNTWDTQSPLKVLKWSIGRTHFFLLCLFTVATNGVCGENGSEVVVGLAMAASVALCTRGALRVTRSLLHRV